MGHTKPNITLTYNDARHILHTLENIEAELEQLVRDEDWYTPDSLDLVESSKQIMHDALGIKEPEEYVETE